MSDLVITQVVEKLHHLPDDLQRRVLDFVDELTATAQRGVSGRQLLRFAGVIALDDLSIMRLVIEAGCERVDLNGW